MSEHRDDDPTSGPQGPRDEVDQPTDATTTRDPKLIGDPLGLGGAPDPDAPSRRPRPKIISLLGEFFTMSRTTAILLVTFVLVGILYSMVKDEPVVAFRPPGPPVTTSETEPATTTDPATSTPTTEPTTETSVPSVTTPSSPTEVTTDDQVPGGQQTTTSPTGATGQQSPPQQSPPPQSPQEQAQQGEDTGDAGAGGNTATTS